MNKKLIKASVAGAAAIALAAGGTTFAAYSDFGDMNGNTVGAGFLKLDLNGQDGSSVATPISWDKLAPGMVNVRTIWLASNNGESVPKAHLSATFSGLVDNENGCSSNSERVADPNTCDDNVAGTGELSRILNFQTSYYPELTAEECATWPGSNPVPDNWYNAFFPSNQGNLFANASGAGHTYTLKAKDGTTDLVLAPGDGVCVGFQAYWPHDPSAQVNAPYNNDDVAQGDSLAFNVKFTLNQV